MAARFQKPTGTQDILPEEQPYWDHVRARARHLAELAGFERLDLPMFEATELFTRSIGQGTDVVDKEMYAFETKGGDPIALRPEFTAGVLRAYIENGMFVRPQPLKLYSVGPTFRYDRPAAGRYRQFTQFNMEILGEPGPLADAEIMVITWDLYAGLGFRDLAFQLNSTGCPRCKPAYVEALKAYYADHLSVICEDCHRRLERNPLRVLDCKVERCQPVIEGAPHFLDFLCPECAEHFRLLREQLDLLDRRYVVNHRLVRGLDYYTKTVFEVWASGIGAQAAVCGGGRYDGLSELLGGPPTPGVGVGIGLDRIILVMKELGVPVPPLPSPLVYVAFLGEPARPEATRLAYALREAGVGTWLAFGSRGLKSQLREAGKRQVRFVVILGADELAAGQATLRDMSNGEQTAVPLAELVTWLQNAIAA